MGTVTNTRRMSAKIQRTIRHPAGPLMLVRNLLEMQMADEPDDRDAECDHQHQKNDPAFASFFPERFSAAARSAFVPPARVLERNRNIAPGAASTRAGH